MSCDPSGIPSWPQVPRTGPVILGEWVLSWGLGVWKAGLPGGIFCLSFALCSVCVLAGCESLNGGFERAPGL